MSDRSGGTDRGGLSQGVFSDSDLVAEVRTCVRRRLTDCWADLLTDEALEALMPGKMLRTRLASRLVESRAVAGSQVPLLPACAAVEMVHTASLCHDDVIDGGLLRRSLPSLWQSTGPSAAVLIGDMLLCEAFDLVTLAADGRYTRVFSEKIGETCRAETRAELLWRGTTPEEEVCVDLARGKTGPLFAFVGQVAGDGHPRLTGALEEAGYCLGTAYQLADDLLDVSSRPERCGKTTGADAGRQRFTLAHTGAEGLRRLRGLIADQVAAALDVVREHPRAWKALAAFVEKDLRSVWDVAGIEMETGPTASAAGRRR